MLESIIYVIIGIFVALLWARYIIPQEDDAERAWSMVPIIIIWPIALMVLATVAIPLGLEKLAKLVNGD